MTGWTRCGVVAAQAVVVVQRAVQRCRSDANSNGDGLVVGVVIGGDRGALRAGTVVFGG